jgi:hypothetical protein
MGRYSKSKFVRLIKMDVDRYEMDECNPLGRLIPVDMLQGISNIHGLREVEMPFPTGGS